MGKVKKMEKGEAVFMLPDLEGIYHETTVIKNFWKCLGCGLVWTTRHDAVECESREHKESYEKYYGGRYINDVYYPNAVFRIYSIRKEKV